MVFDIDDGMEDEIKKVERRDCDINIHFPGKTVKNHKAG